MKTSINFDEKLHCGLEVITKYGENLRDRAETYRTLVTALTEQEWSDSAILSIGFSLSDLHISLAGVKSDFTQLYRILRASRLESERKLEDKPQTEWYGFFYIYFKRNDGFKLIVANSPAVWVHFTSTVCKLKQIGEETYTKPIYEVVCE